MTIENVSEDLLLGEDEPGVYGPAFSTAGRGSRLRAFVQRRNLLIGTVLLILVVLPVLLAPVLSSVGPDVQNPSATFLSPSWSHLMGTDQYGRSMLARVLYGGRYTMGASVAVVVLGGTVGSVLGLVAGYIQGATGFVIMRIVDLLLAFPGLLLALAVAAILGPSLRNAILAVAVVAVPLYARIVEGAAREVRGLPYVRAAQVLGASRRHIIRRHILPGTMPGILVQTSLYLGVAALWVASLGYLGLGVQPPTPEWGQLVAAGQANILLAWWTAVFPGVFLAVYVIAVSLIGDGLRDLLNSGGGGR
jgi:ABC-type dipeptide/oligopeptide/nickel transport system permease subunit